MADPNWEDPCAVLAWLRPQYYRVAAGLQKVQIRHGDKAQAFGQADIGKLDALMARLERQCAAQSRPRPRAGFVHFSRGDE